METLAFPHHFTALSCRFTHKRVFLTRVKCELTRVKWRDEELSWVKDERGGCMEIEKLII